MKNTRSYLAQIAAIITVTFPVMAAAPFSVAMAQSSSEPLAEVPVNPRHRLDPDRQGQEGAFDGEQSRESAGSFAQPPDRTMSKAETEREARRYRTCMGFIEVNPQRALENAQSWQAEGAGLPAKHCMAVAMAALGHYEEAAEHLRVLADAFRSGQGLSFDIVQADNPYSLIASIHAQMGNALLMADQPQQAYTAFSQGLAEAPPHDDEIVRELYIDRARASAITGDYQDAIKDLEQARLIDGWRADIALYLASARRMAGEYDPAFDTINLALELDQDNPAIYLERGNINRLLGRVTDARTDWQMVVARWPQSAAAYAARANLAAQDTPSAPPPSNPKD